MESASVSPLATWWSAWAAQEGWLSGRKAGHPQGTVRKTWGHKDKLEPTGNTGTHVCLTACNPDDQRVKLVPDVCELFTCPAQPLERLKEDMG